MYGIASFYVLMSEYALMHNEALGFQVSLFGIMFVFFGTWFLSVLVLTQDFLLLLLSARFFFKFENTSV